MTLKNFLSFSFWTNFLWNSIPKSNQLDPARFSQLCPKLAEGIWRPTFATSVCQWDQHGSTYKKAIDIHRGPTKYVGKQFDKRKPGTAIFSQWNFQIFWKFENVSICFRHLPSWLRPWILLIILYSSFEPHKAKWNIAQAFKNPPTGSTKLNSSKSLCGFVEISSDSSCSEINFAPSCSHRKIKRWWKIWKNNLLTSVDNQKSMYNILIYSVYKYMSNRHATRQYQADPGCTRPSWPMDANGI